MQSSSSLLASVDRWLRSNGSYESLSASPSSSPSSSSSSALSAANCCSAHSAAHRLPNIPLLPRALSQSLRAAHASYVSSHFDWLKASLLHEEIQNALHQLELAAAQQAEEKSNAQRNAYANTSATLSDASLTWQLTHARQFLPLDSSDPVIASDPSAAAAATSSGAKSADIKDESTVFGLTWDALSGAFKPQSSGIPSGSSIHSSSSSSHPSSSSFSSAPSFTDPAASNLLKSYQALLVPHIENSLAERVDELWNIYDPTGEERTRAEEDAAKSASEEEKGSNRSASIANSIDSHTATVMGAQHASHPPLPPLRSSDLSSLLLHRLNRLHEDRLRLLSIQKEMATLAQQSRSKQVESLRTTAVILAKHHLSLSSDRAHSDLSLLSSTLRVIQSKLEQMQAQLDLDTYAGVAVAQTTGYPQPADNKLIVPALQVIRSALLALRQSKLDELQAKSNQVRQYQSMGSAFDQLAMEYKALQKQIQNKQWTIQELHAHAKNDGEVDFNDRAARNQPSSYSR